MNLTLAKIRQQFWKRWSVDYLNLLQHGIKWLKPYENLKRNGTMVFNEVDNLPHLNCV